MRVHFAGQGFDYQTLRAMAYATYGGAEPGEVLATVERIEDGDTESWHREWRRTARLVEREAAEALDDGRRETARGAALRAHTYYRTAEFFLAPDDPRRRPTYERSRELFRTGADLLDARVERIDVPYEGTTLPGYLFVPSAGTRADGATDADARDADVPAETTGTAEARPTVVCVGGFDAVAEELYFLCGVPAALERGYACVVFDGPGQGAPLRYEDLRARPDWEAVVGPVLDYLEGEPVVDDDRVALLGASFGGYYAPRAAAFDERVAACVAFDHMHDLWGASAHESPRLARLLLRAPDALVDALADVGARFSVDARWLMANSEWVFGVRGAAELQRTLRRYSLVGVADRIDCPTLVLAGEDDHFVPLAMADEFVDLLECPTTLRVFRREEGAAEHCQVGNLSLAAAVIYDWLDETLA